MESPRGVGGSRNPRNGSQRLVMIRAGKQLRQCCKSRLESVTNLRCDGCYTILIKLYRGWICRCGAPLRLAPSNVLKCSTRFRALHRIFLLVGFMTLVNEFWPGQFDRVTPPGSGQIALRGEQRVMPPFRLLRLGKGKWRTRRPGAE